MCVDPTGTHRLGPGDATLVLRVTSWEASLEVGEGPAQTSIELTADATSLRVQKGTGGMQALGDDGTPSATAVVTQTAWGMKPYSALFGALKVADDVEVVLDGHL